VKMDRNPSSVTFVDNEYRMCDVTSNLNLETKQDANRYIFFPDLK